jgi:hypothetical protein
MVRPGRRSNGQAAVPDRPWATPAERGAAGAPSGAYWKVPAWTCVEMSFIQPTIVGFLRSSIV